jgi:hypothetical protein
MNQKMPARALPQASPAPEAKLPTESKNARKGIAAGFACAGS